MKSQDGADSDKLRFFLVVDPRIVGGADALWLARGILQNSGEQNLRIGDHFHPATKDSAAIFVPGQARWALVTLLGPFEDGRLFCVRIVPGKPRVVIAAAVAKFNKSLSYPLHETFMNVTGKDVKV